MSITPIVRALVQAGATGEMILAAVEAAEAASMSAIEARRSNDRERKTRQRHGKSRDVTGQDVTSADNPPSPSLPPQTPPSRPHPPGDVLHAREGRPSDRQLLDEFDRVFWPEFPNKVGKGQATKAWIGARRRIDLDALMAGVRRYVADKPADRPWCNPATWLNGDRWTDEPAPAPALRVVSGQGPPSRAASLMETGRRMLAEERGETPNPDWQFEAERTIDGYAHRRQ